MHRSGRPSRPRQPIVSRDEAFGDLSDMYCAADGCNPIVLIPNVVTSVQATLKEAQSADGSLIDRARSALQKNDRDIYAVLALGLLFLCIVAVASLTWKKPLDQIMDVDMLPNVFSRAYRR